MKWIIAFLVLIIISLQYRLWFGEGSLEQVSYLSREVEKQKLENARLQERNRLLLAEIEELKQGNESIEEKARQDMGMIMEGETFFMIIDEESPDTSRLSGEQQ